MTGLAAHLATGTTTVCRAWAVRRSDGVVIGFTDHDRDLAFDGLTFRADTGLTASALMQTTGLAVDNTEARGVLSGLQLSEADLSSGRLDGAEVTIWLVNWQDITERMVQFRGRIGEVRRSGHAFSAEVRGLSDLLNQPQGRIYQRVCPAVLGDGMCRFDLSTPGYSHEGPVAGVLSSGRLVLEGLGAFDPGWFERGRLIVLSGDASGLTAVVRQEVDLGAGRRELRCWTALGIAPAIGDMLRVEAGCDKRAVTCRTRFDNLLNFRGFPHIPGEDWLQAYPSSARPNGGRSLFGGEE